jgi:hypothetical protein
MRKTWLNVDGCRLSRIWTDLSVHMKVSGHGRPHKDLLSRKSSYNEQACDKHVSYCAFSKPHVPPAKSCCLFYCLCLVARCPIYLGVMTVGIYVYSQCRMLCYLSEDISPSPHYCRRGRSFAAALCSKGTTLPSFSIFLDI